jgi:hypothetical protein
MSDVTVQLPPGCKGLDCKDGTRYTASKAGGFVKVDERHARAINQGQYGQQNLMSAKGQQSFGTKKGQLCEPCGRLWNAWNKTCPKCGEETVTV